VKQVATVPQREQKATIVRTADGDGKEGSWALILGWSNLPGVDHREEMVEACPITDMAVQ
jgi:hypothetical protein